MKAPDSILLALDLYDNYQPLLERAVQIAKRHNAQLHIVHVIPHVLTSIPYAYDFQADMESEANRKLAEIIAGGALKPHVHLLNGTPKNQVVNLAEKLKVDLLIIGSHGKHGVDLLLGSTANGILHLAQCDVFIIHINADGQPTTSGQYKRVVIATDLHSDSREVVDAAKALAQQYNAELYVINVVPDTAIVSSMYMPQLEIDLIAETEPVMNKLKQEHNIPDKNAEIRAGHPKAEILAFAKQLGAELIVIGSHGRKGLKSILLGSTANAVLHGATADVFVARIH